MAAKRIVLHGQKPFNQVTLPSGTLPSTTRRIFLLSPANASGVRAAALFKSTSQSAVAERLREGTATLEEVFTFMSALYFRGKYAYARKFSNPPAGLPPILIITPARGLMLPESAVNMAEMQAIAAVRVLHNNPGFRDPLERDARALSDRLASNSEVVLLGSVATLKYVEPLLAIFGERLVFPSEFEGRGNMSRGGLLLRCCRENRELTYRPVQESLLQSSRISKKAKSKRALA